MINQRMQFILSTLMEHETITVSELSEQFGVSLVTIRKDLRSLEAQHMIIRQHGKISLPPSMQHTYLPFEMRSISKSFDKKCIAIAAVAMIGLDDAIILDSGTTTLAIANEIRNLPPITIATNSVSVANLLSNSEHRINLAGGQVHNGSMCTVGSDAESFFHTIQASKVFIGISGVWDDLSLTTGIQSEAAVKSTMIAAAKQVIVVAANDKFSHSQMFNFCGVEKIDTIITTGPALPSHILQQIERYHIQLIYADQTVEA